MFFTRYERPLHAPQESQKLQDEIRRLREELAKLRGQRAQGTGGSKSKKAYGAGSVLGNVDLDEEGKPVAIQLHANLVAKP